MKTMNILIATFLYFIAAVLPVTAQQKRLMTGIVLSAENNQPLSGASIVMPHGKTAGVTNNKGEFSININANDTVLTVTHIGYFSQTVSIFNRAAIQVILQQDVNELQNVTVHTGYESISKERVTGSFTKLNNGILNEQAGSNIINRLKGVASSVLFDNNINRPALTVRGISTYEGINKPLIVVDNFPYDGNINNINPNDVESITILKDAAAASIWGTRAGNGVIVITTKKAAYNQPFNIQVNANTTVVQKPNLFYPLAMSSGDFIDVETFLFKNNFYRENTYNHAALTPVVELLIAKRDGTMPAEEADAQINALRNADVRNDFDKYVYSNGINQQYAINISGGGNKANYYLSAGLDNNNDVVSATNKRITLKSATSFKPFKNLQMTAALSYTHGDNESGKPAYGSIYTLPGYALYPYAQLADANGKLLPIVKDYRQTFVDTAGAGKLVDWHYYPLDDYKHAINKTKQDDVLAELTVNYNIYKGLSATVAYTYEKEQGNSRFYYDDQSYYARNLVNQFTQINYTTGSTSYPVPQGGVLDLTNNILTANNIRGQLNYKTSWKNSGLVMLAGAEARETHTDGNTFRTYGYDDEVLTFSNTDLVNPYTSLVTGFYSYIPSANSFSDNLNRFVSEYANAAYTYKEKYTVTGSIRKDASNLFGVNSNNRGIPLWSAGAAWNVYKEPFYHLSFIPVMKLRLSYGFTGNADITRSAVTVLSYISNARFTNLTYANIPQFANPDLSWELTKIVNAGIDFTSKNNIVGGTIEAYLKNGSNLFGPSPLDQTTGLQRTSITKNVADMKGHGLDVDLHFKPISKAFNWNIYFLCSYNISKVSRYYLEDSNGADYVGNVGIAPIVGEPVYSLLSFKWAGLNHKDGDPQGYINNKPSMNYNAIINGKTKIKDLVVSGPSVPPVFGSLRNSFTYKGFTLEANITYRLGYYFRKPSINYYALFNGWNGNADYAKRWRKPGDELHTYVPSIIYPDDYYRDYFYTNSSVLVERADNIELEYIDLSYQLNHIHRRLGFKDIRLYLYANNLGAVWRANKDGFDPDYPNSLKPGPNYTLGITAQF